MPVQIYRRERDENIGDAILAGAQGFLQGRKYRKETEDSELARALTKKKLEQADYETEKMKTESLLNKAKYDRLSSGSYGQTPQGLVPNKWDEYGLPSGYYNPRQEILQKQIEEYYKPLSGEASAKYAMSEQGLGNISNIKQRLGFDESGNVTEPGYMRKLIRSKLAQNKPWMQAATGVLPAITAVGGNIIAGKEGRDLALNYGNLIQNLIRLRSGAAVPVQEQIDEFVRTGYRIGDDPETTFKKLQQGYQLLSTIQNTSKPAPRFLDEQEAQMMGYQDKANIGGRIVDLMPKANTKANNSFTVMQDANGNRAKVYADGRIEEI